MDDSKIDLIIDKHHAEESALIKVLLDIQDEYGWLSPKALKRVSEKLEVPLARVQQTATFYKAFSLAPKGRHTIHVCNGTSCHLRGAQRVLDKVQELTGIKPGETDPDLKFRLEAVNCLGQCALGPVMEVDGKIYGKMSPKKAAEPLKKYE
ncbi:MAG: NAD(P)H-dependent oxidoreductase subunit E [Firmicutes bacterium]|nr:NAD(P)H-dependent oxidoreductase subunit E [Bacillota bacterium]